MRLFRFNLRYFIITILLFLIEVLIAVYLHDNFIRPYVGDYLVVILIYSFARSFVSLSIKTTAILTLVFAYLIETLQYFNLVGMLGLQHSRIANIIIGNTFQWGDLVAYTLGILTVLGVERIVRIRKRQASKV